jgi:hypothetical protein
MAKVKEVSKLCICGSCPTYDGTGETNLAFCATGKSEKITEEKGCTCPGCPVYDMMGLRWTYYCTKGAGREQAMAEKK